MKMKIIDILKCGDSYRYFLIENGTKIRWIEFNGKKEVKYSCFKKGSKAELKLAELLFNVRRGSLLIDI
ncbi:hypothetical protein [Arsenophonus nasoniae]|uniref:hypothetical protein n=1 Tax=Arsenophonus nasoniae TaxID=638 RepID=UPI0038792416